MTRPRPSDPHGAARGEDFDEQRIGFARQAGTHRAKAGLRIDDCRVARATMVMTTGDAKASAHGEGSVLNHRTVSRVPFAKMCALGWAGLSIR
jgi:hypothetical protein